jgi:sulfate permease, SulP family
MNAMGRGAVVPAPVAGGASWRTTNPLLAGTVVGLVVAATSVSVGALIFAPLGPDHLATGIRLALLGTTITTLVVALVGSVPGLTAHVQGAPSAILAALAITTLATLPQGAEPTVRFATVVMVVATASLAVGASFVAIGVFRLGRLVRYLPYPVIGGFIAGTGWLLVLGGAAVAVGAEPGVGGWRVFALATWSRWVPALLLGAVLAHGMQRARHPLVFPALLVTATAAFFAVLAMTGGSVGNWREAGLLLDGGIGAAPVRLLGTEVFAHVHWPSWWIHLPGAATVVLVSAMGLSFNAAGLETALRRRIVLDREMRATGLGNLAAAAFGAPPTYPSLSANLLGARLGGTHRVTAWIAAGVTAAAVAFGPALIGWVPTPIVAGVLISLGLGLLHEWVVAAARILGRVEYAIVILILVVIAAFGLLQGVLVGLVLAVLLFVVSYSRVDAVKHVLTGADARSWMRWDAQERRTLDATGAARLVLHLQGFLFFGMAHALLERVERRLELDPVQDVIVDFKQVTGADATALASLDALRRETDERRLRLVFAGVPSHLRDAFARRGLQPRAGSGFGFATSLDEALEAAERRALAAAQDHDPLQSLVERLAALTDEDLELQDLAVHLERIEVAPGERVISDDEARHDAIYVVVKGQVTTLLHVDDRPPVRLETLRGGNLVGDVAFYERATQGRAWLVADEPTSLFRLSRHRLTELTKTDPALAASFHHLAARQLAGRVAHLTRLVEALQR